MTKSLQTTKALNFCEETAELKSQTEEAFLELGSRLNEIKTKQLFLGRWEDFDHYCREELKMTQQTAYKLISIYETFIVQYKVPIDKLAKAGGWTMLATILPVVENKEDAHECVDQAIALQSKRELAQWVREKKTGVNPTNCKHKLTETYMVSRCLDCGEVHRVYEDEKVETNKYTGKPIKKNGTSKNN